MKDHEEVIRNQWYFCRQ